MMPSSYSCRAPPGATERVMLTSDDLLHSYLRLLQHLSEAETASIYIPAVPEVPASSVLIHAGGTPAVPELATVSAAGQLMRHDFKEPFTATGAPRMLEPSRAPKGRLIRLWAADSRLLAESDSNQLRRRPPADRRAATSESPVIWIGLRFVAEADAMTLEKLSGHDRSAWRRALELGTALAGHCRRVEAALRNPERGELDEGGGGQETRLVYRSPRMEALLDTIRRVAPTDAGVLVTGESGTGKELVARTVHTLSPRGGKPPVVVDCAAISASVIDSELFGHERGAYTGAGERTVGRLAEAAGSTLILDEIGELPLEVQAKLLRFVQEKQITPVGSTRARTVDVRLVAVTNRDLEAEVAAGRFRQDLYYRLKVIHAEVPPLAERPEDVPLLMDYYVRRFSTRYGKDVRGLSSQAAALAARHSWPGNVRELENRVLQAVILCEGDEIGPHDLDLAEAVPVTGPGTLDLDLGQLERRHIERVLESEQGSVSRAARRLGIQRNTLYQKIKKYGLERP